MALCGKNSPCRGNGNIAARPQSITARPSKHRCYWLSLRQKTAPRSRRFRRCQSASAISSALPLPMVAERLAAYGQHTAEHARKAACRQPSARQGRAHLSQKISHKQLCSQNAAQNMPDIEQLVVVVIVRLEHDELRQRQDRQPAAVQPPLLLAARRNAGISKKIHKADVLM